MENKQTTSLEYLVSNFMHELQKGIAEDAAVSLRTIISDLGLSEKHKPEPLLKEGDLVIHLKLSRSQIRKLRAQGMPYLKIGDNIRFRMSEVEKFINNYKKN